jgi:hypothetical protein
MTEDGQLCQYWQQLKRPGQKDSARHVHVSKHSICCLSMYARIRLNFLGLVIYLKPHDMSNQLLTLTSTQLKQAAALKEKIEALDKELARLTGAAAPARKAPTMSAAARAKMAAAQKARWAKQNKVVKKPATKPMSKAVKAKLSAVAKARWAKIKAAGKKSL